MAFAIAGCGPRGIETIDDVERAAGYAFERAETWSVNARMSLTRPTHISEWEVAIYSDHARFAAIVNAGARDFVTETLSVIDGEGAGWTRITQNGERRVIRFDGAGFLNREGAPAFVLPGNVETGLPFGMFLSPDRALDTIASMYDFGPLRRAQIDGVTTASFRGTIRPGALAAIDPEGFLNENGLPIDEIEVAVRFLDGGIKRVQFLDEGSSYWVIDYFDYVLDAERKESRFGFDAGGAEVEDVSARLGKTVAGVDDGHALFAWSEAPRN